MRWDLTRSSLGDSPKESGSSLGTRREITGKKTEGLVARLPEVAGVCGRREPRVVNLVSLVSSKKLVLYIGETNKKRKANKTLKKGMGKNKPSKTKVAKKDHAKDNDQCFHYGKDGE
ncbi:hypothetical protein GW17_00060026 [Ensete ventricosum]|nr:hypothetical protein GW17_00060026 [Ensete ventricosum]